jgi:transposase
MVALSSVTDAEAKGNEAKGNEAKDSEAKGNEAKGNAKTARYKHNGDTKEIFKFFIGFFSICFPSIVVKSVFCYILIALRLPTSRIAALTGFCIRTVRKKIKMVRDGNWKEVEIKGGRGRKSKLADYKQEIKEEIESKNYKSRQQIVAIIKQKFNIIISVSAVGRFMKQNGIKRLKCGSLPAKADPVKQREFLETILRPLMELAKAGSAMLFFMDASHFVMGNDYLDYVYCTVRRYFKTGSGRQRYNVLGALDFVGKKVLTITNNTYITAVEVCELLNKIADEYKGQIIYIILDNAKYQKCKLVLETATQLGINLVYIPPYSPNLNLIERYWKYVKGNMSLEYHENYQSFFEKIDSIIALNDIKALESLITENFQIFDNMKAINETTYCQQNE